MSHCHKKCCEQGPPGQQGPPGAMGLQGPPGTSAPIFTEYITGYKTETLDGTNLDAFVRTSIIAPLTPYQVVLDQPSVPGSSVWNTTSNMYIVPTTGFYSINVDCDLTVMKATGVAVKVTVETFLSLLPSAPPTTTSVISGIIPQSRKFGTKSYSIVDDPSVTNTLSLDSSFDVQLTAGQLIYMGILVDSFDPGSAIVRLQGPTLMALTRTPDNGVVIPAPSPVPSTSSISYRISINRLK